MQDCDIVARQARCQSNELFMYELSLANSRPHATSTLALALPCCPPRQ